MIVIRDAAWMLVVFVVFNAATAADADAAATHYSAQ